MENGVFIPERELLADPHWGPCTTTTTTTTTTFVSTTNLRDDVTTTFAKVLPHKSFRGGLRCQCRNRPRAHIGKGEKGRNVIKAHRKQGIQSKFPNVESSLLNLRVSRPESRSWDHLFLSA
jgi:hypothetical protein